MFGSAKSGLSLWCERSEGIFEGINVCWKWQIISILCQYPSVSQAEIDKKGIKSLNAHCRIAQIFPLTIYWMIDSILLYLWSFFTTKVINTKFMYHNRKETFLFLLFQSVNLTLILDMCFFHYTIRILSYKICSHSILLVLLLYPFLYKKVICSISLRSRCC